jgi:glycoside/pentoside/hexuronide:cation symporter, GPH family
MGTMAAIAPPPPDSSSESTSDIKPAPGKLSILQKLAFGIGDLGPAIFTAIGGFYLNAFLLTVAGLRPATVALIFLIVKIWDSVNDPIVGALTDKTRTRWGRRRPWLLFGAIPFGILYFLYWIVPPLGDMGKFWYYLIVAILFDTTYTAINVPYSALTPELSQDYDERTSLNSYRFGFSILGGVAAASLHGIILSAFPDNVFMGYRVSALIWAVLFTVSVLITFAFTKESHFRETDGDGGPGFFEGLRIAFSNRAFVYTAVIFLLSWLALQFIQGNLLLYVDYWLGLGEHFPFLILGIQVSSFIWLLIWARVSRRIGKQRVYYLGAAVWILVLIGLYFLQPGQVVLLYVLAILAGIGVSVAYLVPWSLLPDVIEMDELETGQRREGVFYGFFVFLQKLGLSAGLALSNLALEAAHFITPVPGEPAPDQPASVLMALRIFVSLVPAAILLLSYIPVYLYPITREKHAEMLAQLAARKAQG